MYEARFISEHEYSKSTETPNKVYLKRKISSMQSRLDLSSTKLKSTEGQLTSARKKIKMLLQSKRRLAKRQGHLQSIISALRKENLMSNDSLDVLEKSAGGLKELFDRLASKRKGLSMPRQYSAELRSFALTLHFYSPAAYRYVRKVFETCLPHPRTVEKWYFSVDASPGFTEPVFKALEAKAAASSKPLVCSLLMDEMAIRQQLDYTGQFMGYIDMGTETDDDSLPLAKEALVFMIVGLNDAFKVPVGYFLINGLGGKEKANLVEQLIKKLHDIKVTIVSLTFDGAAANFSMCANLGCALTNMNINSVPKFAHPVTKQPIFIFPDPCHMIKLVRNTLGDKKLLKDRDGNMINYTYLKELVKVQNEEGLHLSNKLKLAHLQYFKKKMNVKLAVQLLSESVATSLEYCASEGLKGFQGCEGTIKFIRMFNNLFDVFNSRNLRSYGFKAPISLNNIASFTAFLNDAKCYIFGLKEICMPVEKLILKSNRKTGFLGFIICINSLLGLIDFLTTELSFNFLCTYRLSQDHLELFFGKIRRMGCCNNNPSATQFRSAYRKLIINNQIEDIISGNCLSLQDIPILTVSSSVSRDSVSIINETCNEFRFLNSEDIEPVPEGDYWFFPDFSKLSEPSQHIVSYIAGFVVFKLRNLLKCDACISSLESSNYSHHHRLINFKTRGKLLYPSDDVFKICFQCEVFFRKLVLQFKHDVMENVVATKVINAVLKSFVNVPIFTCLVEHMFQCEPQNNHVIILIKAICEKYLKVRYAYASRKFSMEVKSRVAYSRQKYNKLILFAGL